MLQPRLCVCVFWIVVKEHTSLTCCKREHDDILFVTWYILNQDANTTSDFNLPFLLQTDIFPVLYSASFPLNLFRFTSCFSFCCQPVTLICWQLCLCWTHWVLVPFWPFLFQWHHPRNKEAARGVASRSSLYFTLLVSTLLRFNLNNLI